MSHRLMAPKHLPHAYYTAAQTRELDRLAIAGGVPGFELMGRAAKAILRVIQRRFPSARRLVFIAGAGNNGGDAFLSAALALQAGYEVSMFCTKLPAALAGDARQAAAQAVEAGVICLPIDELLISERTDLIVDGLLGTGFSGVLRPDYKEVIDKINSSFANVLAIDMPSGLPADTGYPSDSVVKADTTITFIGVKRGLVTAEGPNYSGQLWFDSLDVRDSVYSSLATEAFGKPVEGIDVGHLLSVLPRRSATDHKGKFGHLLLIGGTDGMLGAILMAGLAALRTGVGLVSVATRPSHAAMLSVHRPELMAHGIEQPEEILPLLEKVSAVVVGPGLGQDEWAEQLLKFVFEVKKPTVFDADALNIIAAKRSSGADEHLLSRFTSIGQLGFLNVMTPHPGEAARLLGTDVKSVQADRFASVVKLSETYGMTAVLKGAGTLVASKESMADDATIHLNRTGNPGMASGGMGDILAGLIGSLLAQGVKSVDSASLAVAVHGAAADWVAKKSGEVGMLATDLISPIRELLNGRISIHDEKA